MPGKHSPNKRTRQYCLLSHTWSLMIWSGSLVLISEVSVGHFVLCFMSSKMEIALFLPYLTPPHTVFQGNNIKPLYFLRSNTHAWNITVHLLTVILCPPPPAYKKHPSGSMWWLILDSCFMVFPVTLEAEEVKLDQQVKQEKPTQINHQSPNPKNLNHMSLKRTLWNLIGFIYLFIYC